MRLIVSPILLMTACLATAQTASPAESKSLFVTTSPQLTVDIRQDPLGPNLVVVTMLDPHYPPATLQSQIKQLGEYMGGGVRGLQVFNYQMDRSDPNTGFVKATFAVDGLCDLRSGLVRLTPLVQAFAGVPEPNTIKTLAVVCEGLRATSRTVRVYAPPAQTVLVEGRESPEGVEYRIQLNSQNPAELAIKDDGANPTLTSGNGPTQKAHLDFGLIALIGVAVAAVGALVYCLVVLLPGRNAKARS